MKKKKKKAKTALSSRTQENEMKKTQARNP